MNELNWIAGPLIGAVIGYCTNYIAVKMLFRPLCPVKIGRFTLPFTPGMIPKGKERLAKALGTVVGHTLLTKEDIEGTLLTEDMTSSVILHVLGDLEHDTHTTLAQILELHMGVCKTEQLNQRLEESLTQLIVDKLLEVGVGDMIVEEGGKAVRDKIQKSFLRMMVSDDLIQSMMDPMGEQMDDYIRAHGVEKIQPIVFEEIHNLEERPIFPLLAEFTDSNQSQLYELVKNIYESFVRSKAGELIDKIDISKIVEEKICQMDVKEVETLTLSVMKKELNAIVNLGALIGFVIGLVNLLFR